jgi:hypothetical protein
MLARRWLLQDAAVADMMHRMLHHRFAGTSRCNMTCNMLLLPECLRARPKQHTRCGRQEAVRSDNCKLSRSSLRVSCRMWPAAV